MWQKHHPIKLGPKEEKMLMQDGILIGKHISLLSSNTKPCFNLTSAVTAKFQLFILLFDVECALNITVQIVIGRIIAKNLSMIANCLKKVHRGLFFPQNAFSQMDKL